jgi:hypothetical protein
MLCEVMSVKHDRLWKKHMHGYHETCLDITRWKKSQEKGQTEHKKNRSNTFGTGYIEDPLANLTFPTCEYQPNQVTNQLGYDLHLPNIIVVKTLKTIERDEKKCKEGRTHAL